MKTYHTYYKTPIGTLSIVGTESHVLSVDFVEEPATASQYLPHVLQTCLDQFDQYFQGTLSNFDLPLQLQGTDFQKQVWLALMNIPFGKTVSYGEIARQIGNPKAVRAVGMANKHNKIAIIIPCHRVIGKNGKLTGYGGGVWRKEWLLNHENRYMKSIFSGGSNAR
ncbi:MAG: cysteine methyltransferase [Anaerolineaceae bacterium 4572_78]|nr:MAG: cysteine methyltransferase [Anaerolineaceae bacterium 4572_78]